MKKILAVLAVTFIAGAVAARPADNVAQELMKLENDWAKAGLAGDAVALEKMLAPDYVYTNPEADTATRSEMINGMKSGATKYDTFKVEDMKVHVYGDAAVVTGKATTTGMENGKHIDDVVRFTDTWVKRNGKWACAATQVTRIPKK